MTIYGDTGYFISLSTGVAGATPTHYPTGDIIYLYAVEYEGTRSNKDKIKQMANNNSYSNRMGKIAREVDLRRCIILDDDAFATDNTTSYNQKITLLDSWTGLGKTPLYLIITPKVDNPIFVQPNTNRVVNLALSRTSAATSLDYFKSTITRINTKPIGGHYQVDLSFKETNLY